jgi:glycosyltransferase involved in cell wall biosynthesis
MKKKIAIVRGKFLNKFEMQSFEPLHTKFDMTAFGSLTPFQDNFAFPTVKLPSPMDLPEVPLKMPVINRLFIDAHYLYGLEEKLKGFDIAHSAETYYRYTQQCLDAKRKGYVKKVVVTVLENIVFNNEGIWGRKTYKMRTRNEADMFIALTQKTKDVLLEEGAEEDKIVIIGSGINTDRFKPSVRLEKNFIQKNKEITILFVGRLEKYKGIFEIIHAFNTLLVDEELKGYKLKLRMIGDGSEKQTLTDLERNLGISKFVEHRTSSYDEIHTEYQNADIFVAPSFDTPTWTEQYGYMLLESQATGLPIITTDAGSISEVVEDGAIQIKQQSSEDLYEELKKLILSPALRQLLSRNARKRATSFHDIKRKAQQVEKVYNDLL